MAFSYERGLFERSTGWRSCSHKRDLHGIIPVEVGEKPLGVSVVIINYRTGHLLQPLARRLLRDPVVREVIVVDNSADDPSDHKSFGALPVRLVPLCRNMGFSAAVNVGLRAASHRYAAIINPDVQPDPLCVSRLYSTALRWNAPLVGPRFYWDLGKTFRLPPATGACLWWDGALRAAAHAPLDVELLQWYWIIRHERFWKEAEPFPEPFLSGALFLLDRKTLADGHGSVMDERFFLYYEDSDLSLRALALGCPALCDPAAGAVHFWNQSPEPKTPKVALMEASHKAFYEKYYGSSSVLCALDEILNPSGAPPGPLQRPSPSPTVPDPFGGQGYLHRQAQTLGTLFQPPRFSVAPKDIPSEPLYLECAPNPFFIPFAQADFSEASFLFPEEIWRGLAPGTYYSRLRGPRCGTIALWQWTKP